MQWLLPHLDEELSHLKSSLAENNSGENTRLQATNILFQWVTDLFYRFAWKKDIIEEVYYRDIPCVSDDVFGSLLKAQAEKVSRIQQNRAPKGNVSYYILEGYRGKEFDIVSSRKEIIDDKDCLVEKGALCIKTKTLLEFLQDQANFQAWDEKRLSKELKEEGVLTDTKEGRAAKKKSTGSDIWN